MIRLAVYLNCISLIRALVWNRKVSLKQNYKRHVLVLSCKAKSSDHKSKENTNCRLVSHKVNFVPSWAWRQGTRGRRSRSGEQPLHHLYAGILQCPTWPARRRPSPIPPPSSCSSPGPPRPNSEGGSRRHGGGSLPREGAVRLVDDLGLEAELMLEVKRSSHAARSAWCWGSSRARNLVSSIRRRKIRGRGCGSSTGSFPTTSGRGRRRPGGGRPGWGGLRERIG